MEVGPTGLEINSVIFKIRGSDFFHKLFFKDILLISREMGRVGEREGKKHQCVVASCVPPTGDLAHNPGKSLTRNRTGDPLAHRPVLNPLSHTSQGKILFLVSI